MTTPDSLKAVFDELTRTDVNFKSRIVKKRLSLLSNDDQIDFIYNDCQSIEELSQKLDTLYGVFKLELSTIARTAEKKLVHDAFFHVKIRISEAEIFLNPKDKDLVFARITYSGNNRQVPDTYQIDIIKRILINYVQVQRSYLKLIKSQSKNLAKHYAPEFVTRYGKRRLKGQQTLFPPIISNSLSWQSETVKLVELGAALAETQVFGPDTTRKDIYEYLAFVMNCPLDNAEQALSQMKHRKNSQTKFMDEMTVALRDLLDKDLGKD